ncbi:centromere-associated protein E isoform X2 [Osmia bicornis bicornis]|uniref:centromere-associated protein E isoform X2 n=1 Tax=Osmia bicornis bicornis TaxID=1437191 RepID=UPI0010F9AE26|nr:centromere-associated protein E isoform X2 [Osmia bicornis bicornis]
MKYILIVFLQLLYVNLNNAREITHEDIKDAMLSLVHMMRENTEKLERHEARERQLGEQLKKTISVLTKRMSVVDAIKLQLTKLDEKVMGIEQLISQRDERERIQMQKTVDTLEDLENRLEGWFTDIENKINGANSPADTVLLPPENMSQIVSKLNDTEALLMEKMSKTESLLKSEGIKLKEVTNIQTGTIKALLTEIQDIGSRIKDLESSLEKVKEQSQNIKSELQKPQFSMMSNIDQYCKALPPIQKLLEDTSTHIKELPRTHEMQSLHNEIETLLNETKHDLKDVVTKGITAMENKLTETKNETKDTIGALRMDLANNAGYVNQELNDLEKGQSVMISMADHVLDTKKRVEYGVHQILLEIGDLVKAQGININNTLNERFDGISNDIMDNQNGALANLTTKMEQEMNQVWRQINVMYQQMTESAKALDKLHKQNEEYVNGTTSTMGGMETKVGEITKRMREVDENLNYLLGRLSLVTQEFNQIKTGLGNALDNIKASFKEVQEKTNNLRHPGPHRIPDNYQEPNESNNKPDVMKIK